MKKLLFDNLGLKITAVILSILLWLLASSRGLSEISLDIPIEFKDTPPGLELINQSAKVISLNVKSQERIIRNIRPSDIRVSLDLSKAKIGEATYYINKNDIKLPPSVTVTNINPSSVKVLLEESVVKTVQVKPVITGTPEKGFYVKSITVMPHMVEIEGAQSVVKKVDKIKTEQLNITGFRESFSQDVKLDVSGINIRTKTKVIIVKVAIAREKE